MKWHIRLGGKWHPFFLTGVVWLHGDSESEPTPIYDALLEEATAPVCGAAFPVDHPEGFRGGTCVHRGEHRADRNGEIFHLTAGGDWWTDRVRA